jgi:hypothetical protein
LISLAYFGLSSKQILKGTGKKYENQGLPGGGQVLREKDIEFK